ncbi:EAL domain-containing protein [Shewanella pneumatophori]|uniref:EAL domain-containing protein n=1 Tax=Shewanella pneumatophori TaxID=314092 RepID=A0A9X1ZJD4_9GAMM|nr:EAL domain-containing protein [Shewanella pneumatophori]MCL1140560.1 EAL domain-containing protein [Shewanella pneumatophori]
MALSHYQLASQLTDVAIKLDSEYQQRLKIAKAQMTAIQVMLQEEQKSYCSEETISLLKNKLFKQSNLPVPWVRFNDENIICSAIGRWPVPEGGRLLSKDIDGHGLFEGMDARTFNKQKTIYASATNSSTKVFVPVQSIQEITQILSNCNVCGGIYVHINGIDWINNDYENDAFVRINYQAENSNFKYTLTAHESARNQLWLTIFLILLLPTAALAWLSFVCREAIIKAYWHQKFTRALKNEAFHLAYQPIIDTDKARVYSVEALIRWRNKNGSYRETNSFIRYLEQDLLMPKITKWMIKTALNEMKSLLMSEQIQKCSINISAKQIEDGELLSYLQHLANNGYPLNRLCFELTERQPILSWQAMRDFIAGCKQLGCLVKLDDVGTGYGGGLVLQQLEFDYLKIDKAFIKILTEASSQPFLLRSYIAIAEEMDIKLIAEGVETTAQAEHLKQLGIHLHQGWLYSKALPADELRRYILNF